MSDRAEPLSCNQTAQLTALAVHVGSFWVTAEYKLHNNQ
jgi:hypothetical protein